jgi:hypothetical protein
MRLTGRRSTGERVLRDSRCVGLVHEHQALLVPRPHRRALAFADVDLGRTRLSVML